MDAAMLKTHQQGQMQTAVINTFPKTDRHKAPLGQTVLVVLLAWHGAHGNTPSLSVYSCIVYMFIMIES